MCLSGPDLCQRPEGSWRDWKPKEPVSNIVQESAVETTEKLNWTVMAERTKEELAPGCRQKVPVDLLGGRGHPTAVKVVKMSPTGMLS